MTRHDFTPGAPANDTAVISLDDLRKVCPSAFATKPSPKVSERYTFVSTAEIIAPLIKDGWTITQCLQRRTRADGRNPLFTRHMIRLRAPGSSPVVGDVFPEVVITNSHDRQCRFTINGGLFRLVCSNGLVIGVQGQHAGGRMVHLGDIARIQDLIKASLDIAIKSGKLVTGMMKKKLDERAQAKFAAKAAELAYDKPAFDPKLLLTPRRDEDKGNDLWTVLNRVQENIVRGGIKFGKGEETREVTTRGITHIGRSLDLNTGLWDLAQGLLPKAA